MQQKENNFIYTLFNAFKRVQYLCFNCLSLLYWGRFCFRLFERVGGLLFNRVRVNREGTGERLTE